MTDPALHVEAQQLAQSARGQTLAEVLEPIDGSKLLEATQERLGNYSRHATLNKVLYFVGEGLVLLAGALTTCFAALGDDRAVTTVLAALTVLLTGLVKVGSCRDRWFAYGSARNELGAALVEYNVLAEPDEHAKQKLLVGLQSAQKAQNEAWQNTRKPDKG